ncbi:MAG TPA: transglutaminase-like domain-containing protein [Planctomycetota bacterium]|nr:transglutaminase-like domain-containing protein [Planctomycetota bacterium]
MIRAVTVLALLPLALAPQEGQQTVSKDFLKPGDTRTFAVSYTGQVKDIPAGAKKLRVWLPVPQDSTVQAIKDLSFSREMSQAVETKYGNKIAYAEIENPGSAVEITMKFVCTRSEIKSDFEKLAGDGSDPANSFPVFRGQDTLVTIDDEIKKIAADVTKDKKDTVEKARAIYEYVLDKMAYDKSGKGWGTGSTKFACEVGKGNCTDFHALFNSLCRAQGIASGFEIGLYLPYEKGKVEPPGGYHCWAFFRVPGKTWVPVDASEADRFPDRAKYFFGGHTSNRVTLSTGRDITLAPKQDGAPLNYFLNPYAEADGRPVKCEKTWSYKDLD